MILGNRGKQLIYRVNMQIIGHFQCFLHQNPYFHSLTITIENHKLILTPICRIYSASLLSIPANKPKSVREKRWFCLY